MTKQEVITQIKVLSKCHLDWRLSILVNNMEIPTKTPNNITIKDCDFDTWYSENEKYFFRLIDFQDLKKQYSKSKNICKTLNNLEKQKVVGIKKMLFGYDELKNKRKIEAYYKDLSKASKKLIKGLTDLENQILALSDDRFTHICSSK